MNVGMRSFGYWLGVALLIAGAVMANIDYLHAPMSISLGWLWAQINANSLVGFQSLIENHISPAIWPPILDVLLLPISLVVLPIGILLVIVCGPGMRA